MHSPQQEAQSLLFDQNKIRLDHHTFWTLKRKEKACSLGQKKGHLHVSVCEVLKVVPTDALVGVWRKDSSTVTQTPKALHTNSFPRV